jgi:hypothetical protein
MNAAAIQPCASCGRELPTTALLYGSSGMICQSCDANAEAEVVASRATTQLIIAPPALGLIGTFAVCLPFINLFVPGLCGLGAVASGISAIRLGATGTPAEGVTGTKQVLLIAAGAIGGLWGFGLAATTVMGWLGIALS